MSYKTHDTVWFENLDGKGDFTVGAANPHIISTPYVAIKNNHPVDSIAIGDVN